MNIKNKLNKKALSLIEIQIAISILVFIIISLLSVYHNNQKNIEENRISILVDEYISEQIRKTILQYPIRLNTNFSNNLNQLFQEVITILNYQKDYIKNDLNNNLKQYEKKAEITDINFYYIQEKQLEITISNQPNGEKTIEGYVKVEYQYKTKYSKNRNRRINIPIFCYLQSSPEMYQPDDPPQSQPRDSISVLIEN